MRLRNQIRRWHGVSLSVVLCVSSLAVAADTPATTIKPSHPAVPKQVTKRTSTHSAVKGSKGVQSKKGSKRVARKRGQQAIDSGRAREIQMALIREHYMQGQPSGMWDSTTQAAMQRYQADQGWQSKTTPDSRALIKLGLGPNHDHLLNPESAMIPATNAAAASKSEAKHSSPERNLSQR